MRIGGRDTNQDWSRSAVAAQRLHQLPPVARQPHVKGGALVSRANYDVTQGVERQPALRVPSGHQLRLPGAANYGVGDPDLSTHNRQIGFFVQDDWPVAPRLTVNLGLRWDYESDMINTEYVTPAEVGRRSPRTSTTTGISPMATTGRRSTAPGSRASASRTTSAVAAEPCCSAATAATTIASSTTRPRRASPPAICDAHVPVLGDGASVTAPTIPWDPSYLSKQGLDTLIAGASRRIRRCSCWTTRADRRFPISSSRPAHRFRPHRDAATYGGMRTERLTYICGNRRPDGTCCLVDPRFRV